MPQIFIILTLFFCPFLCNAQRAHHHNQRHELARYSEPFTPRKNAVTGAVNLGAIFGCAAIRVSLAYERFLGKEGDFSATISLDGFAGFTGNNFGAARAGDIRT